MRACLVLVTCLLLGSCATTPDESIVREKMKYDSGLAFRFTSGRTGDDDRNKVALALGWLEEVDVDGKKILRITDAGKRITKEFQQSDLGLNDGSLDYWADVATWRTDTVEITRGDGWGHADAVLRGQWVPSNEAGRALEAHHWEPIAKTQRRESFSRSLGSWSRSYASKD